jgi:hypothetical protein
MVTGEDLGAAAVGALPLLAVAEKRRVARLFAQVQRLDTERRRVLLEMLAVIRGALKNRTPSPESAALAATVEEACVLVAESLRGVPR